MKKKLKFFLAMLLTVLLIPGMIPVTADAAAGKLTPGKVAVTQISSPAYNKITIKWNCAANATHYKIYYKKAGTGKWISLATVSSRTTSYTHTASGSHPLIVGQKYTYTVRGYNSHCRKYGSYDTDGLTANTKPASVKLNRAALSSDKKSVTVSWNRTAGCNYYCIFRRTASTGWKRLANVRSPYTVYTDRNPVKGQTNIYTVRGYYSPTRMYGNYNSRGLSVNVAGYGAPENTQKITPGAVALRSISASGYNKINIQWKKTSNATHYKIYYKKAGAGKWTGLATVSGSTTGYTHTASASRPLIVGQKYTYTVRGYNSLYKTYGSYNTKGLTSGTKPATVKLNRASLSSDKKSVTVSWNRTAGCNYYCIFRRTASTGWKRLANVRSSYTVYTDRSPVQGQKNIYTVRGYYSPTATYGNYNSNGVSVSVPRNSGVHKHSYTSSVTRQPTCRTQGIRTYRCSCGYSYTQSIPATGKHTWLDQGTDLWLDWTYGMQEDTGPTKVSFKAYTANVCTGCGFYYGLSDTDDFIVRLFDHMDHPETEYCGGAYTLLDVHEVHHLLECKDCGIFKCGEFSHYEYIFTWHGRNDHIKLEDWQIADLGLPFDGTVKINF